MTKTERTILTIGADGEVTAIYVEPIWPEDSSPWLWGWKCIAASVGRSERWARRLGRRMPVAWVDGRPGITKADLYRWLKRQEALSIGQGRAGLGPARRGPAW